MSTRTELHVKTPLLPSPRLSDVAKCEVLLKLENCQPSGSFKLRGSGFHCQKVVERGCKYIITASSGNTGLAVATAGRALNVPVSVFVPTCTPGIVLDKIQELGAHVTVHGANFGEANERALEESRKPGCSYIHPYMHPECWEGHSTLVDEVAEQLQGRRPGCFVVSVGGGGLLRGLLLGMSRHNWQQVPVLAMETSGADCLHQALIAGKVVDLPAITSIAVALGARSVLPELLDVIPEFRVCNHLVSDMQAVQSCLQFADDHRVLVEPACGAALSAVYCGLVQSLGPLEGPAVVVVCGGSGVSLSLLQGWAQKVGVAFPEPVST